MALLVEGDSYVARLVPAGTVIAVDPETVNGDELIDVMWEEKCVMMFSQDVRACGTSIEHDATGGRVNVWTGVNMSDPAEVYASELTRYLWAKYHWLDITHEGDK